MSRCVRLVLLLAWRTVAQAQHSVSAKGEVIDADERAHTPWHRLPDIDRTELVGDALRAGDWMAVRAHGDSNGMTSFTAIFASAFKSHHLSTLPCTLSCGSVRRMPTRVASSTLQCS